MLIFDDEANGADVFDGNVRLLRMYPPIHAYACNVFIAISNVSYFTCTKNEEYKKHRS